MVTQASVTRAEDLRVWRSQYPDAVPIGEVRPRRKATCVGVVHKIRLVPGRQLEVTVDDGSGRLTGVFTGRSNLPGLSLGAGLRLTGTVAGAGGEDSAVILNPAWESVSEPYE